ncbi:DJ-1/PfpI family protein [uncultured Oxalicibacterium sp.]|uniref:DJ-1/PfpI family protein n=1 Tax=uncultured Oxalicibacterium sp. TaxID=1168540 RepID=UPI0025EC52D8|nr:DJ-1/PfpI family protein [uncultured Oxalicibacterium sp.]
MHIAILTFDGFNELDSLIAFGMLHRAKQPGWRVAIASPNAQVTSMNGLQLQAQLSLEEACNADAVLIGSGMRTRDIVNDAALLEKFRFDPSRQLLGAQCSGTLIFAKLGLLGAVPACTDLTTKPWVEEAGVATLDQPFTASGNIATAGGCLASQYLAGWTIARLAGCDAARSAMHYIAPVGEKEDYIERMMANIAPYLS